MIFKEKDDDAKVYHFMHDMNVAMSVRIKDRVVTFKPGDRDVWYQAARVQAAYWIKTVRERPTGVIKIKDVFTKKV